VKNSNKKAGSPHITRGNVLEDIGFSAAESLEIRVKADIYRDLLKYIKSRGFTQHQLVTTLGIHQPDVSNLLSGKVSKFSVGKLITFAGRLDLGAEVKLTGLKKDASTRTRTRSVKANRTREFTLSAAQ